MDLLAVLSAAGVRRSLVYAGGREGLAGRDGPVLALEPEVVDRVLARLGGASLLTFSVDGSTVSAHRLVMRVIRENLAASGSLTEVCEAAALMLDTLAGSMRESWHEDRAAVWDLIEQIMALYESSTKGLAQSSLDRRMLNLRFWAVMFMDYLGDRPAQAIAIGEQLLADHVRILGADHPDTLSCRNNLAVAYFAAGRIDEAITLYEQNLAVRERVLGPEHPSTLTSRHGLAVAYRDAARIDEAITLYEQTLAAQERSWARTTPIPCSCATTSPSPIGPQVAPMRRSPCTSRPWPPANGS